MLHYYSMRVATRPFAIREPDIKLDGYLTDRKRAQ